MISKKKREAGNMVDVSRLGVNASRGEAIYLIASNIGRSDGEENCEEQRRLSSLLLRQFDWCFESATTSPIDEAVKLFMASNQSGIEDLWSALEQWSETHPTMVPGQLFAIPFMCEQLSNNELMLMGDKRDLLVEHISQAVSMEGCDIHILDRLYSDVELADLDWLEIKKFTADVVSACGQPPSEAAAVQSDSGNDSGGDACGAVPGRHPYFVVGYAGAKMHDRKMCASIFGAETADMVSQAQWARDLTAIMKALIPNKSCEVGGRGMYSLHDGLRVASRMKKSAAMLRQAQETLQKAALLPAEVKAFVSIHAPSSEDATSLIMRAALVNRSTNEIIGGCDYQIAAMEDLVKLEQVVSQCLKAVGIEEVESIRLISSSSTCEGCGENLYLVPSGSNPSDPDLQHAISAEENVDPDHSRATFH
jgi:hypothetical protein